MNEAKQQEPSGVVQNEQPADNRLRIAARR
jgi:hypothetical protein